MVIYRSPARIFLILTLFVFSTIFFLVTNSNIVHSSEHKTTTLNKAAERDLDFDLYVGLREFEPNINQTFFELNIDIDDNHTKEPFNAWLRTFPATGDSVLNVTAHKNGFHKVDQILKKPYNAMRSNQFLSLNTWPFDEYYVDMFLQIDRFVSLSFDEPIDTSKVQSMANHPDWDIRVESYESSIDEVQEMLPSSNFREETIESVFKFKIIIEHSEQYWKKHLVYTIITFIPTILIVAHIGFVRNKTISIQVTLFTGIAIFLITSLFALRQFLPLALTVIEFTLLVIVGAYAIWFFINLGRKRKQENNYSRPTWK